jgi:hypothetical protein
MTLLKTLAATCHYRFLVIALLIYCCGCEKPRSNRILSSSPSPDGKLRAVVFERDGAVAKDYTRNVSILQSSQNVPNSRGNVYVTGTKIPVSVIWLNDSRLKIVIHGEDKYPFVNRHSTT